MTTSATDDTPAPSIDRELQEWLAGAIAYALFGHDRLDECADQQREAAMEEAEVWMGKPGNEAPLPTTAMRDALERLIVDVENKMATTRTRRRS